MRDMIAAVTGPPSLCLLGLLFIVGCGPGAETETSSAEEAEADAGASMVAQGSFSDKGGQSTLGAYRILRSDGDLYLELTSGFQTDDGPDLHVILSPSDADSVVGASALADGSAFVVGELQSLSGTQRFDLEDDLTLDGFRSVLIHCIEFSHLYGAASIP